MAGWDLKFGDITDFNASEEQYWSYFNFVFSDACSKRNTYKFGLIKAILDNLFNAVAVANGMSISYHDLFAKFAENYWNLVVKYDVRQMRKDTKAIYSKVERVFFDYVQIEPTIVALEFGSLSDETRNAIISRTVKDCKTCVVGALYQDFEGTLYSFNLKGESITIAYRAYDFMLKYKIEIEQLNYYSWAKFLEKINGPTAVSMNGIIGKLENAIPKRANLKNYRDLLWHEFEEHNCFYCGKKLSSAGVHVDHFIPWSFMHEDKVWNLVLSCASCNEKKNNRLPPFKAIIRLEEQNQKLAIVDHELVHEEFRSYAVGMLPRIWRYAKLNGLKELGD